jgi:hypothetical protein
VHFRRIFVVIMGVFESALVKGLPLLSSEILLPNIVFPRSLLGQERRVANSVVEEIVLHAYSS